MTDPPRSTILPPGGAHVPSPTIPRSVPPPLPTSAAPSERDEDLPQADPIAYLGTAQHPVSVAPTVFDLGPPSHPPSSYGTALRPKSHVGERVAMTALAALLIVPVLVGLSEHTGSKDTPRRESAVAGVAGVSDDIPAKVAPVADAAEVLGEAAVLQIPPLEITSRWAEVRALRRAARENRGNQGKQPAEPATAAAATATPFDFSGAMNAIIAAGIGPGQCGAQAVGAAAVAITFAPSGRATRALVESGPLRGTDTGSCIATQLREVRIAPFDGDRATVRTTVFLR